VSVEAADLSVLSALIASSSEVAGKLNLEDVILLSELHISFETLVDLAALTNRRNPLIGPLWTVRLYQHILMNPHYEVVLFVQTLPAVVAFDPAVHRYLLAVSSGVS
jgi:hypothetical protein